MSIAHKTIAHLYITYYGQMSITSVYQGTSRLFVSVSSRWSLVLLGVRDQVSVPVSLTLKKRDRTRYRYRSLKKIETGLGLGIVNFKKTRPDSVSVSFTQKKRDRTLSRYRSLSKNETRLGIGIVKKWSRRKIHCQVNNESFILAIISLP